ncbi:hypothetical protein OCOJLMKI_1202 [Methylobacterium iners]|uniref:Uncharacterized protein n=1 Tax=Methylobacterium iners TaxID=418707 RepID=A0ABQ4RWC6_9HYPH|nr:hypothetical protein OCOJLMKI_1202 [Methylobacterium iners]
MWLADCNRLDYCGFRQTPFLPLEIFSKQAFRLISEMLSTSRLTTVLNYHLSLRSNCLCELRIHNPQFSVAASRACQRPCRAGSSAWGYKSSTPSALTLRKTMTRKPMRNVYSRRLKINGSITFAQHCGSRKERRIQNTCIYNMVCGVKYTLTYLCVFTAELICRESKRLSNKVRCMPARGNSSLFLNIPAYERHLRERRCGITVTPPFADGCASHAPS